MIADVLVILGGGKLASIHSPTLRRAGLEASQVGASGPTFGCD
ncbi:hypothetical protein [Haloechinothrix halophila]|nr:hypothetical protein [Haloechinothrix halophila]